MAQKRPASVFKLRGSTTSKAPDRVAEFVEGALRRTYDVDEYHADRPEIIHAKLVNAAREAPQKLLFVIGNRRTVAELAKADERSPQLESLQLDVANPRSSGIPFYLFARGDSLKTLNASSGGRIRVAFGVSQRTRQLFDESEAAGILGRILASKPEVVRTTTDHGELLDYLLADPANPKRADLVGIYDEEPSVLLHDFLAAYRPRAGLGSDSLRVQLYFLATKDKDFQPQVRVAGEFGSTFSVVPYERLGFYDLSLTTPVDGRDGLITISPTIRTAMEAPGMDTPVLLSNVRRIVGEGAMGQREKARLQQVVSFSFLAMLFTEEAGKRCLGAASPLFQAYLLQALFADTRSLPKGLALWSNLSFAATPTKSSKAQPPVEVDLIERMINERLIKLETSTKQLDYRKVADTLTPGRLAVPVREQFTNDDATMFRRSVDLIRTAVDNPIGPPATLMEARRNLLQLLQRKQGPTCDLQGLGLFGEKSYDPFFYLSLIDSLLSLQTAS